MGTQDHQKAHIERIDASLNKIYTMAHELLDSVNREELTDQERMEAGIKMMNSLPRFMALRQQIEAGTPTGAQERILDILRQQMRGEDTSFRALGDEEE